MLAWLGIKSTTKDICFQSGIWPLGQKNSKIPQKVSGLVWFQLPKYHDCGYIRPKFFSPNQLTCLKIQDLIWISVSCPLRLGWGDQKKTWVRGPLSPNINLHTIWPIWVQNSFHQGIKNPNIFCQLWSRAPAWELISKDVGFICTPAGNCLTLDYKSINKTPLERVIIIYSY